MEREENLRTAGVNDNHHTFPFLGGCDRKNLESRTQKLKPRI